MKLSYWFALVGLTVGLGCLQVAQRNAIVLKAYAVGQRIEQAHGQETRVGWLTARVIGLSSPGQLVEEADARRLTLVAWSPLMPASSRDNLPVSPVMRVASGQTDGAPSADETAD